LKMMQNSEMQKSDSSNSIQKQNDAKVQLASAHLVVPTVFTCGKATETSSSTSTELYTEAK
jgi:hypothetical protein